MSGSSGRCFRDRRKTARRKERQRAVFAELRKLEYRQRLYGAARPRRMYGLLPIDEQRRTAARSMPSRLALMSKGEVERMMMWAASIMGRASARG